MLRMLLTAVQVFSSMVIVALVLLQRGKGADAGAGFGSGASGTVFGARGATTALSRATAVFAAIFMINSLALAYIGTMSLKEEKQKTILEEAAEKPAQTAPANSQPAPAAAPASPPATSTPTAPAPAPAQPPK